MFRPDQVDTPARPALVLLHHSVRTVPGLHLGRSSRRSGLLITPAVAFESHRIE